MALAIVRPFGWGKQEKSCYCFLRHPNRSRKVQSRQLIAAQGERRFVRGLILAAAMFIGIQLAKWAGANLEEWQRLAVEFVGGLIGY